MGLPPLGKERMLFSVERGGDLFTQVRRLCHEVIKPSQNATKDRIAWILGRHATYQCNWYSTNTA
jgi:hypothetical protein